MAKKIKTSPREKSQPRKAAVPETPIGFGRTNFILYGAALATIVLGFIFLSSPAFGGGFPFIHPYKGGTYGWLTMNAAPVLLVLGYCVLLPWAIIKK
jgi:hypothetical protein